MDTQIPAPHRRPGQLGEEIEERIVTGVYPPGMHLDEQELAAAFGVSRTPIREALIQLASIGLVEIRPRRGATVPEMSADRLCEMFEVMAELESMCGRLAARRILPAEQARLKEAHLACEAARDAGKHDFYYQLFAGLVGGLDAGRERPRNFLGVPGSGEPTEADIHPVADELRGAFGGGYL